MSKFKKMVINILKLFISSIAVLTGETRNNKLLFELEVKV